MDTTIRRLKEDPQGDFVLVVAPSVFRLVVLRLLDMIDIDIRDVPGSSRNSNVGSMGVSSQAVTHGFELLVKH